MQWFYKAALFLSIAATTVSLTGCGNGDDVSCAFEAEHALDMGDFNSVIALLENNGTCNGQLSSDEAWLNLGAAYMGKAGMTISGVLTTLVGSSGSMSSYMAGFASAANSIGLNALWGADRTYTTLAAAHGFICSDTNLTSVVANACFYNSMVSMASSMATLTTALGDSAKYLTTQVTFGSIDDVNDNNKSDGIEVTSCAIQDANITIAGTCTETSITYNAGGNTTFSNTSGTIGSYIARTFMVEDLNAGTDGNQSYYKLIDQTASIPSPISTSGTCSASFTNSGCTINMTTCFPCPVIIDGNTSTTTTGMLDVINGDSLAGMDAFLPGDINTTSGLQSAIYDACISGGGAAACVDDNVTTETELAFFLLTL